MKCYKVKIEVYNNENLIKIEELLEETPKKLILE